MKLCPTCHRTFDEAHLSFCTEDGTPLVHVDVAADESSVDETTRVSPSPGSLQSGSSDASANDEGLGDSYQPPGSYVPPDSSAERKSRAWPWVVGVLAIILFAIIGIGVAGAMLYRNIARQKPVVVRNDPVVISDHNTNANANTGSDSTNWNQNSNNNSAVDDTTPPPTDSAKVLADLKQLEDEWTVANINADKKKLNHILADDYVGITNGRAQGKAQYLKTIEPDTAIQHWEFETLKVNLSGDRASLSGVLRVDVKDENGDAKQLSFRFTDKFVWRDGRWQATASEVAPVPVKPGTTV